MKKLSVSKKQLRCIIREELSKHELITLREAIRELLGEGVYDPGILKAVFMAGGPGSGKSFSAKVVFGVSDLRAEFNTITQLGLKLLNSDPAFNQYLKEIGVDPGSLGDLPQEKWEEYTSDDPTSPRERAKTRMKSQEKLWSGGRLGLIVDGTGDNFGKMKRKKAQLESLGYDTAMMFVDTTLDVAQTRNKARGEQGDRFLKPDLVEEIWTNVQANREDFMGLFGNTFYQINNTKYGPPPEELRKAVNAFIEKPVQNPIGKKWIDDELAKKKASHGPEDIGRKTSGEIGQGSTTSGRQQAGLRKKGAPGWEEPSERDDFHQKD
jgi:hypothetical protein